jgi:hypothetical protein
VNQNGHAKGWVTKARQSLGVLSTAIGIDLLNVIRAGIFLSFTNIKACRSRPGIPGWASYSP